MWSSIAINCNQQQRPTPSHVLHIFDHGIATQRTAEQSPVVRGYSSYPDTESVIAPIFMFMTDDTFVLASRFDLES